jgi:hypothetical protein
MSQTNIDMTEGRPAAATVRVTGDGTVFRVVLGEGGDETALLAAASEGLTAAARLFESRGEEAEAFSASMAAYHVDCRRHRIAIAAWRQEAEAALQRAERMHSWNAYRGHQGWAGFWEAEAKTWARRLAEDDARAQREEVTALRESLTAERSQPPPQAAPVINVTLQAPAPPAVYLLPASRRRAKLVRDGAGRLEGLEYEDDAPGPQRLVPAPDVLAD